MNIHFIGFGNMAKAMAKGLMHQPHHQLAAAAPSLPTGIYEKRIHTYPDNLKVLPNADVIVLAVKPLEMKRVLTQISAQVPPNCLVLSIASGITVSFMEHFLPKSAIVRAMPNIAVAVGKAATPLFANGLVTSAQKQHCMEIFSSLGLATWVNKESEIDAFTALSGSGPAYVFLFMEAMIKAAVALGIEHDIAKTFTIQTLQGAISLASETNLEIDELRRTVTSPAGTTAAALSIFNQHGFDELIYNAMLAASERAKALGNDQPLI